MGKFEDIKVGDIVYVDKYVDYGWNHSKSFTIPVEVTRLTKAQFTTEDGIRYRKSDGRPIGSVYNNPAYRLGESITHNSVATNETESMNNFQERVNLAWWLGLKLKVSATKIVDSKVTTAELDTAFRNVREALDILEIRKK